MELADISYGNSAAFRPALDGHGLVWAVVIARNQEVYEVSVQLVPPADGARMQLNEGELAPAINGHVHVEDS